MGRSACCSKVGLRRGPWSAKEDTLLASYIQQHGEGQWRSLPKKAGLLRCGKSCRLRWMNYLRPGIKRGNISEDEEDLIVRLHRLLGNRWSLIAGRLPGRTDNEIKNYWNTHLFKKLNKKTEQGGGGGDVKIMKKKPNNKKREQGGGGGGGGGEESSKLLYSPKPIRLSSSSQSYDSLVSGGSSSTAAAEVVVSAFPPLDDPPLLCHFSDSISGDVNMWEKVFAEYFHLL